MKKILASLSLVLAVAFAQAQTDSSKNGTGNNATGNNTTGSNAAGNTNSGRTQYDYYPDANVYYNQGAKTYSYYDSTSSQWRTDAQLPSGYSVDKSSKKNSFYHNGTGNVWDKNADDMKKYGRKNKTSGATNQ